MLRILQQQGNFTFHVFAQAVRPRSQKKMVRNIGISRDILEGQKAQKIFFKGVISCFSGFIFGAKNSGKTRLFRSVPTLAYPTPPIPTPTNLNSNPSTTYIIKYIKYVMEDWSHSLPPSRTTLFLCCSRKTTMNDSLRFAVLGNLVQNLKAVLTASCVKFVWQKEILMNVYVCMYVTL